MEARRQYELEYRVVTASGEERWVLERGCAVHGDREEWLDGIIFDITNRRRFEEAARRAEADAAVSRELAEASKRIVFAADEARRRIERDLHDGAQQSFVCARMTLGAAQRQLADDHEAAAELLHTTQEHLKRGLNDLRDLARGIHPSLLAAGRRHASRGADPRSGQRRRAGRLGRNAVSSRGRARRGAR